ncbi:MAG: phenylalanine--tRNA ligase subunit beta [Nitrospina sp.]|jgi:phenylalanyl-tRNA synthetase beta chain|nr:phenylalanine--tRNA ligase subunit beta [Nitrospina sp.]MBT3413756.1 phenylalanine--tRNA ligase subunit beta [Nitrospina sp.]MBT3857011.1 phenylalanine--tRNA ligase subunit beta [Nitrospina sp.]MBT4105858.1 phenylalanine--tRNA ligase subunit beta [Nitrospina sp.]MBT4388101.1 phenylalanine--tRNA ligase subunit beta [Nitrospina sp.]
MKVQVDWLKEYTEIDVPADELGHVLTMAGLEIESHETVQLPDGENSEVLELNVTPNRGYCLSHIGVAREVSALLNKSLKLPDPLKTLESEWGTVAVADRVAVENLEPELCPRYCALVIENVKVGPSPKWLKDRLTAIGLRPINNIVDITNFVMMEYGQPLHAFDRDLLAGNKIIIRRAKKGEPFASLDGTELKLEPDALVIADGERPVALAGIMGGTNSQVSETTRDVVLESACFDPATVRQGSKKYGLRSDSSYRFERGVDFNGVVSAQARAVLMMKELAGGEICSGRVDINSETGKLKNVSLRVDRVNQLLGTNFDTAEVVNLLSQLGMKVTKQPERSLEVKIPSFRPDLSREADLIEEIARIDGFDKVDTVYPVAGVRPVRISARQNIIEKAREVFCCAGFAETIHYSFIERVYAEEFKTAFASEQVIALKNPLSSDYDTMRTSLLPGLLKTAALNLSKGQKPLKLFEVGSVYSSSATGARTEKAVLSAIVLGPYELTPWKPRSGGYDFYDLKGTLETLITHLHLKLEIFPDSRPFLVPEKSVRVQIGDKELGYLGQMTPEQNLVGELDVYALELDLGALEKSAPYKFQPIAKFPEIYRDISILVDRSVTSQKVADLILKTGNPLIQKVELYDHFAGKKIQADKKSLTFALSFQSAERTLSDEEVNPLFEKIVQTLKSELGASLRE